MSKRFKVSKNFYEDELIPPAIYNNKRLKNEWFIDKITLRILQSMRDFYGPMIVNDWFTGGQYKYSGYRNPSCPEGSKLSMHRHMKAMDPKPRECSPSAIIDDIIGYNKLLKNGNPHGIRIPYFVHKITCVEYSIKRKRPTWAHWDTRPTRKLHGLLILKL